MLACPWILGIVLAAPPAATAVEQFRKALSAPELKGIDLSQGKTLELLATEPFAAVPLGKQEAQAAAALLWKAYADSARANCQKELDAGVISAGGVQMKIATATFGQPASTKGHSVWISMHGGGGAPAEVNDKQWENQKKLYTLAEGIYVAPRAPTNEWNLWHQAHIDPLFARLITDLVIARGADANRVYLMGYSAGGDGVYQLAPRMADQLAAAAMMAGHPNDAKPDGLRNIGFTQHAGENDSAYNRNAVTAAWGAQLDALQKADPAGYQHWTQIHKGKGHWMDRQDAAALPWMAKFTRDLRPARVVWLQDDVTHARFYWLAVDAPKPGERVVAARDGQRIALTESTLSTPLRIRLDDRMCDVDKDISVTVNGGAAATQRAVRTIGMLLKTLSERGDPEGMFCAEISVAPPT